MNLLTAYGTMEEVASKVCACYYEDLEDVKGERRYEELVIPRHVTMYILRKNCHIGLRNIGRFLGNRDHSTVLHGITNVQNRLDYDSHFKAMFNQVLTKVISQ